MEVDWGKQVHLQVRRCSCCRVVFAKGPSSPASKCISGALDTLLWRARLSHCCRQRPNLALQRGIRGGATRLPRSWAPLPAPFPPRDATLLSPLLWGAAGVGPGRGVWHGAGPRGARHHWRAEDCGLQLGGVHAAAGWRAQHDVSSGRRGACRGAELPCCPVGALTCCAAFGRVVSTMGRLCRGCDSSSAPTRTIRMCCALARRALPCMSPAQDPATPCHAPGPQVHLG